MSLTLDGATAFLAAVLPAPVAIIIFVVLCLIYGAYKIGTLSRRFSEHEEKIKSCESAAGKIDSIETGVKALAGIGERTAKIEERVDAKIDSIENGIKALSGIGERTAKLEERVSSKIDSIESSIKNLVGIGERTARLEERIELVYMNTNPKSPIRAHSPLALTELGTEIVEKTKAREILNKHKKELIAIVENKSPGNAYDIQMASLEAVRENLEKLLTADELTSTKDEAFNKGMILSDVLSVVGILLRDQILKEKGIPITEVDINDPHKNRINNNKNP